MPIHHRIAPVIFSQVGKWSKYERRLIDSAYRPHRGATHFRNWQSASMGVRHGLAGGAIVGQFINEDGTGVGSGQIFLNPPRKSYKTRRGYSASRSSKRKFKRCNCSSRRKSKFSKFSRMRFR